MFRRTSWFINVKWRGFGSFGKSLSKKKWQNQIIKNRCIEAFSFFFFFFFFLGHHPQHMEVPRLGVQSELQQHEIWTVSATYTTAHCNARSSTHWARPGIELATSWFLVGSISAAPQQELQGAILLIWIFPGGKESQYLYFPQLYSNAHKSKGYQATKIPRCQSQANSNSSHILRCCSIIS